MNAEIDWLSPDMIDRRQAIAPLVTLPPEQVEFNRQSLLTDRQRYDKLNEIGQRPFQELLVSLKQQLKASHSYPVSARLLSAAFLLNTEAQKTGGAAVDILEQQGTLNTKTINHVFAHQFDIASGIIVAADRVIIVEDELNGLTAQRIERRNQLAIAGGFSPTLAGYAEIYGESTAYAKDSADLLAIDDSDTPGIKLFEDLINKVKAGQFVPGVLTESFRELVILGMEDAKAVYQSVYRHIITSRLLT